MFYWILKVGQIPFLLLLSWLTLNLRTPLLASLRSELQAVIPIAIGLILLIDIPGFCKKPSTRAKHLGRLGVLTLCAVILTVFLTQEIQFQRLKHWVLAQDPAQLSRLGQHLVVGYRDKDEVKTLIEKQGITGVFITLRNIQGKSKVTIRQDIADLQTIRTRQGLSPLWIATDQEGGVVSRLSPPLTQLPPIAAEISTAKTAVDRQQLTAAYGDIQGQELAELGINLNFAPVIDLNKGIVTPGDRFSVIYQRAISEDKTIVAAVAQQYCATLANHGVQCTLKHFPGLGRLDGDTHLSSATLDVAIATLAKDDWIPFQQVMGHSSAFTMLGHPILSTVDPDHPVSFSKAVVDGILRQQWQHQGVLITDDFSMGAVFKSRDGIDGAVVKALQAGVDLILISYDTDLYYRAMAALMRAENRQRLSPGLLQQSQRRLAASLRFLSQGN